MHCSGKSRRNRTGDLGESVIARPYADATSGALRWWLCSVATQLFTDQRSPNRLVRTTLQAGIDGVVRAQRCGAAHEMRAFPGVSVSSGLTAVPVGMASFATTNESAGALIASAGSADSTAMLAAAAAALGPIGATYLAAYGQAQAANLAATLLLGAVHTGIGAATSAASASITGLDSSFSV
jgi:hypothetical protein